MILFCSHIESFSYFSSCSWNQSFVQFCREKYKKKKNGLHTHFLPSVLHAVYLELEVYCLDTICEYVVSSLLLENCLNWTTLLQMIFQSPLYFSLKCFRTVVPIRGSSRLLRTASWPHHPAYSFIGVHVYLLAKIAGVDISLAPPEAVYSLRNRQSLPSECYIRPFMSGWLSWPYGILARSFSFRTQSRSGPLWWACWISVIVTVH